MYSKVGTCPNLHGMLKFEVVRCGSVNPSSLQSELVREAQTLKGLGYLHSEQIEIFTPEETGSTVGVQFYEK